MNTPEPLFIRADAGERIGTGHVMRMIALAQAYQDRGGAVTMACVVCPDAIADRVRREKIEFERIGDGKPGSAIDLEQTIARAKSLRAKWVVLDGYHFGVEYQRALREMGFRVLAVDDYGHCETWAADAVLNQNIFAPELKYRSEAKDCRFLLGTRFALLRREFHEEAERCHTLETDDSKTARQPIRRLLVTLGGADPDNATGKILAMLNSIAEPRLEIKLLIGSGSPHFDNLRQLAETSPHKIELLQNVLDMPSLYRWADGVVSAGGGTCWEWLFYRLPAAVICIADNQRPVITGLVKHRLAIDLGWHKNIEFDSISMNLRGWLEHGNAMAEPPKDLAVDGLGADRVASVLDGSNAWLCRARAEDAQLWFQWANDPAVRANGFHPEPIPWETHFKWFEHHRQSSDSRLWIGFNLDAQPLGYVRLHRRDDREWEIGVAVDAAHRGQGMGLRLVSLARMKATFAPVIVARIKPANAPSLKLFEAADFDLDAARTNSEYCVYTLRHV